MEHIDKIIVFGYMYVPLRLFCYACRPSVPDHRAGKPPPGCPSSASPTPVIRAPFLALSVLLDYLKEKTKSETR